jgi:pimeloyl-ACP methyl ester carboxylesterase
LVETRVVGGRTVTFRSEVGEGPAIVCIHGSAGNHHVYDPLLDALRGRRTLAINLPGRAGTDGPALATASELADFVGALIEQEVEGDYLVAGHSLGGGVALEHALGAPTGLVGLVLLATGARLRVHPMILELFEQIQKTGERPPSPPGVYEAGVDPALIAWDEECRLLTPIASGGADWRACDAFDRVGQLGGIGVPALVVAGSNDMLTPPKYAQYLASEIQGSELQIIEGAGHMLVFERVPELAGWIRAFAERTS